MPNEHSKNHLVDLTFTFDGERPEPNRFKADPKDSRRPDAKGVAPSRPMPSGDVAELVNRGNLEYASFIEDCQNAASAGSATSRSVKSTDHRLFLNSHEIGIDGGVAQEPYAAFISCIDARVPVELITGQAANDTFVIRTAGNTLTGDGESSGSLRYILSNYGVGSSGAHRTVSAVFVVGHSKCGAVKAAYDAYKPGGGGTAGMHESLAKVLREIKFAVDFVLSDGSLTNEEEIKDAISHVNAVFAAVRARQTAAELNVDRDVAIYYASYHVTDFRLRKTNFPNAKGQKFIEVLANKSAADFFSWDPELGMKDKDARRAVLEDAIGFARKQ